MIEQVLIQLVIILFVAFGVTTIMAITLMIAMIVILSK